MMASQLISGGGESISSAVVSTVVANRLPKNHLTDTGESLYNLSSSNSDSRLSSQTDIGILKVSSASIPSRTVLSVHFTLTVLFSAVHLMVPTTVNNPLFLSFKFLSL